MWVCSAGVGLPQANALRFTHHDLSMRSSSAGKPMNRNTISAGSGNATAFTYSAGAGPASISSISSVAREAM